MGRNKKGEGLKECEKSLPDQPLGAFGKPKTFFFSFVFLTNATLLQCVCLVSMHKLLGKEFA
jgi:hypothetical protein